MTDCEWWMEFMATMTMIGTVFAVILLIGVLSQFGHFLHWIYRKSTAEDSHK